jgi:hypothetical protein
MKRILCVAAGLCGLLLLTPAAYASGYNEYLDFATATNTDGAGCTKTATYDGLTIPLCVAAADGSFDVPTWITSDAANALSAQVNSVHFVNLGGPANTDNVCFRAMLVVMTQGTNPASIPYPAGNNSAIISKALGSQTPSCNATAATDCYTGAAAAVKNAFDEGTGADCLSTDCTNRQAFWHVIHLSAANCPTGAATSVSVPGMWVGIQ